MGAVTSSSGAVQASSISFGPSGRAVRSVGVPGMVAWGATCSGVVLCATRAYPWWLLGTVGSVPRVAVMAAVVPAVRLMVTGSLSSAPVGTVMVVAPSMVPLVTTMGMSRLNGVPMGTTTLMEFVPTFSNPTLNENGAPGLSAKLSQPSWVSPANSPSGSSIRAFASSPILFSRFSPAKMS